MRDDLPGPFATTSEDILRRESRRVPPVHRDEFTTVINSVVVGVVFGLAAFVALPVLYSLACFAWRAIQGTL